jgi:hypothetical protein
MQAAPLSCLDGPSTKHSPLSKYANSMANYDECGLLSFRGYASSVKWFVVLTLAACSQIATSAFHCRTASGFCW